MNFLSGIAIIGVLAWMFHKSDDDDSSSGGNTQMRIDTARRETQSREYWGQKMLFQSRFDLEGHMALRDLAVLCNASQEELSEHDLVIERLRKDVLKHAKSLNVSPQKLRLLPPVLGGTLNGPPQMK